MCEEGDVGGGGGGDDGECARHTHIHLHTFTRTPSHTRTRTRTHLLLDLLHVNLRLREHTQLLRLGVPQATGEGGTRVRFSFVPYTRRVVVLVRVLANRDVTPAIGRLPRHHALGLRGQF